MWANCILNLLLSQTYQIITILKISLSLSFPDWIFCLKQWNVLFLDCLFNSSYWTRRYLEQLCWLLWWMLICDVSAVDRGSNPVIFYIFPDAELEKHVQELKRILQACSCYFSINIIGSFFASAVQPRQERSFFISFHKKKDKLYPAILTVL